METEGRFIYELGNRQWDVPGLRKLLEEVLPRNHSFQGFDVEHEFPVIGRKIMLLNASRFVSVDGRPELILIAFEDITERRRAEDALQDSEVRYRRLFEAAKDGILILDASTGRVLDANPFMTELLGYPKADFMARSCGRSACSARSPKTRPRSANCSSTASSANDHLPLETRSGRVAEVEFVSNVYQVDHKLVAQCNIRDISERSRMEKQITEQAAALSDLHRRKDEFLAMLSHELRNPLAPIANAIHLLRLQRGENTIQLQARHILERQVGQMSRLVDDLLEISRITTGRVQLRPETHRGERRRRECRGVGASADQPAPARAHGVTAARTHLAAGRRRAPRTGAGEPAQQRGQIHRRRRPHLAHRRAGGRRVRDAGAGYGRGHRARNSCRASSTCSRRPAPRWIARRAASASASVSCSGSWKCTAVRWGPTARWGHGSEFVVRLPVRQSLAAQSPSASTDSAEPGGAALRVLVVDDNVDAAQSLAMLVKLSSHDVRTAHTGPGAMEAALDFHPNVVLLDIGLPGFDGYEVAKRMRQLAALQNLVLVALTGYGQESDRQRSREAGFDHHLVKPADFGKVHEILVTTATQLRAAES